MGRRGRRRLLEEELNSQDLQNHDKSRLDMVLLKDVLHKAESAVQELRGKKVVIVLGGTGAGKTAFLHFLAGSKLQRRTDGRIVAVDSRPDMDGFTIGHDARSETKNLRTLCISEEMGSVMVDTCGYLDTTNAAVDLAMSILFRKVADDCSGIRFVLVVDHPSLTSHRGESMRMYARLVSSLVDFQKHKRAWSFVFTKIPPPELDASDLLNEMRNDLADQLTDICKNTRDDACREILAFMHDHLPDEETTHPSFVDVFHPESSSREALLGMVSPPEASLANNEPGFIGNPGGEVRCGLTTPQENLLRLSLNDLDQELQSLLEKEDVDISRAEENVAATKYLREHAGLQLVDDSWDAMQKHLKEAVERLTSAAVSSVQEDKVVRSKHVIGQLNKFNGLGYPNAGPAAEECLERRLQCLAKDFDSLESSSWEKISLTTLTSRLEHLDLWTKEFDTHRPKRDRCTEALKRFIAMLTSTTAQEPDIVLCQLALLREAQMKSDALSGIGVDLEAISANIAGVTDAQKHRLRSCGGEALEVLHQILNSEEPQINSGKFQSAVKCLDATRCAEQRYHNSEIKKVSEEEWGRLLAQTQKTYETVREAAVEKSTVPHEGSALSLRALIRNLDGLHLSFPTILHENLPVCDSLFKEVCSMVVRVLKLSLRGLEELCDNMEKSNQVQRVQDQLDLLQTISQMEWLDEGELGARIHAAAQGKTFKAGSVSEHREGALQLMRASSQGKEFDVRPISKCREDSLQIIQSASQGKDLKAGSTSENRRVEEFEAGYISKRLKDLKSRYDRMRKKHLKDLQSGLSSYLQQPSLAHKEAVEKAWELSNAAFQLCQLETKPTTEVEQVLRKFLDAHKSCMDKHQPLELQHLDNFPADSGNSVRSLKDLTLWTVIPDLEEVCTREDDYWKKVASLISGLFDASGEYEQKNAVLRTISTWSEYHRVLEWLPKGADLQQKVFTDIETIHDQVEEILKTPDFRSGVDHPLKELEQIAAMDAPTIKTRANKKLERLRILIDLKNTEVDEAVEKCIRTFQFAELPSLVQPPTSADERMWLKFRGTLGKVEAALDAQCHIDASDASAAAEVWRKMIEAKKDIGEYMKQHMEVDIAKKMQSISNVIEEHLSSLCKHAEFLLAAVVTDFQQLRYAQHAATEYGNKVKLALEANAKVWKQLECLEKNAQEKVAEVDRMVSSLIEAIQQRQECDPQLYKILSLAAHQKIPEYVRWQLQLREQLDDLHTRTKKEHCSHTNFKDIILLYQNLLREWQGGLSKHVQGLSFDIHKELKQFEDMEEKRLAILRTGKWDPCAYLPFLDPRPEDLPRFRLWGFVSTQAAAEHYRNQFRADVDSLILDIEESIRGRDIAGLSNLFESAKSLNDPRLRKHLETPWLQWARLSETKLKCVRDFSQLCSSAAGQVSCGEYRRCSSSLKNLSEYLRHIVPFGTILRVQDVQTVCTEMHGKFSTSLKKKLSELETACKALDCSSIRRSIEDLRSLAKLLTGDFATYVADLRDVLKTGDDDQLNEMMSVMQTTFSSKRLWELGSWFSILELPDQGCDSAEVARQKRKLAQKYHPDKQHLNHQKVMQRINDAADHLSGRGNADSLDHLMKEYAHLLQDLFSAEVRGLPDRILSEIKDLLQRKLYDEVMKHSEALVTFELVTELVRSPPMDANDTRSRVSKEIQGHVDGLERDVVKHCNDVKYSELQRDLEALDSCIDAFSGHDAGKKAISIRNKLTETVKDWIEEKEKRADETRKLPVSEEQMQRFARDLLDLGEIWSDIMEFRNRVRKHMDNLLSSCLDSSQKGPLYLHKVGLILSRGEASSQADNKAKASSVGQQIINDFEQFKNVQVMLWNRAVSTTQLAPEKCVKQMTMNEILQNGPLTPEKDDLLKGLTAFKECYDRDLKRWMDQELTVNSLVTNVMQKATDVRRAHASKGSKFDITAARPDLPPLLAGIFLHYTVTTSGDSYQKLQEASDKELASERNDNFKFEEVLVTPHNTQVLAALTMLGFGRGGTPGAATSPNHLNHLVQVRTGEGKSLILGALSTLFALLGFDVCCVCYSHYLSNRDWKIFSRTFTDFQVTQQVKYSKITDYSEETTARRGNIRELTNRMLREVCRVSKAGLASEELAVSDARPSREAGARREEVLLIDEVDVLFSKDFYGRTHDQLVKVPDEDARAILEELWVQTVGKATTHVQLFKLIKQSDSYKRLAEKYSCINSMIDTQVAMMCSDLLDYKKGLPPRPIVYEGRIGYQKMDSIEYDMVDGYKTAFANLDHRQELGDADAALKDALCLLVPCGQFSYANVQPAYMFGVSGTVKELDHFQRKAIARYGIASYTVLPSVYGTNSTKFLDTAENPIQIVESENFFVRIAKAVEDKVKDGEHQRAAIVFFQDSEVLNAFVKSKEAGNLVAPNVLQESLTDQRKEHYIRKAATVGQVTLATAIFGRGCDFACFDETVHQHGGMHVIQTFVSKELSEEVQIQGRTARQGKNGTFGMILNAEDLSKQLGLSASVSQENPERRYDAINKARQSKHQAHFQSLQEALEEATRKDKVTQEYFMKLLEGNWKSAVGHFEKVLKNALTAHKQQASSTHFLILLDMSGSMQDDGKFDFATSGALTFLESAEALRPGQPSAFSLIMFDDEAEVAASTRALTEAAEIFGQVECRGGGTSFSPPLAKAIDSINASLTNFDHHAIMLYTDGHADFPEETQGLRELMSSGGCNVSFYAVCENENPKTLHQVCKTLYPDEKPSEHCMSAVAPEQICGKMQEVLQRMNVGFARGVTTSSG